MTSLSETGAAVTTGRCGPFPSVRSRRHERPATGTLLHRPRSAYLRRPSTLVAPVAADAGSFIDNEQLLARARAICEAFGHQGRRRPADARANCCRADDRCHEELLDARLNAFLKLGLLRRLMDKKH